MSADVSVSACYSIVRAFRNEFYFPFDRDTSRISRAVREKMPKERKQPGLPRPAYGRFFEPSRARPARRAEPSSPPEGEASLGAAADRRSGGGREPSFSLRPSLSRRQAARASAAGRRAPTRVPALTLFIIKSPKTAKISTSDGSYSAVSKRFLPTQSSFCSILETPLHNWSSQNFPEICRFCLLSKLPPFVMFKHFALELRSSWPSVLFNYFQISQESADYNDQSNFAGHSQTFSNKIVNVDSHFLKNC